MEVSADAHERSCPACGAVEERITGEFDTSGAVAHLHYEGAGAHWLQKPLERTNPGPTTTPLERFLSEFAQFNKRCTIRGGVSPLDPELVDAAARFFARAIKGYERVDGKALVKRDGARRSLIAACAELVCIRGWAGAARIPDLKHMCTVFETTPEDLPAGRKILGRLAVDDPDFRYPDDCVALLMAPLVDALAQGKLKAAGVDKPAYREAAIAVTRKATELQICHTSVERSRVAGGLAYILVRAGVGSLRAVCAAIAAAGGPQASTIKKCAETYRKFNSRFAEICKAYDIPHE